MPLALLRRNALLSFLLCLFANQALAIPGDIYLHLYASQHSWDNRSVFGHAFMCVSYHLRSGIKEECFGFYPKSETKMLVGGPGLALNEAIAKKPVRFGAGEITAEVAKKVTSETIRSVLALGNEWNAKEYVLANSNCIDFVHAVASLLGLKRPARSVLQTPTAYVKALEQANPD